MNRLVRSLFWSWVLVASGAALAAEPTQSVERDETATAAEKEQDRNIDIKLPPNGTTEDQNQILRNLSSQGYDAISVSVIAPNDQTA